MVDLNPARGMPLQLQRYWLVGKGALKIRWNIPGDFMRCVHHLEKYFPTDPKGLCNILHTKATGGPPGHGSLEPHKLHHSILAVDTEASLTAATQLLAKQPTLGDELWAGPLAPIGRPTGEPSALRQFDPGSLLHRSLPLPVQHRRVNGPGHAGGVVVGRILGITTGPDENGDEYCWGWGDWLDPSVVPEVTEAKYLMQQGVAGPSVDPGGQVAAVLNPDTGVSHMRTYTIGGVTLVAIPAFTGMRWQMGSYPEDDTDMAGNYSALMDEAGVPGPTATYASDDDDCGCSDPLFTVNPPGWRGLPLAARDSPFDNDDAIQRIAAWAGIGTQTPDISKMTRAFMWRDPKLPDNDPTAYRLPVGDIVNGKLTLMYHAIYAAAALLNGAHGGLPDVPDDEKNQIRHEITSIYGEMAQAFGDSTIRAPWDKPLPPDAQGGQFAMADNPKQPYGDVAYADPGYQLDKKKRYPIDTAEHVRSAWSYINKGKNAGMYNADQLKSIKDRIKAAAKKLGVDIASDDNDMSLLEPPMAWFEDPVLPGKTAFTVEDNGRVYGHLAAWNECHRDVTNRECVLAPHSKLGYRPFHLGQVRTAEGDTIQVGKVVQDTRHADIHLGYMSAAIHYDNTGDEIAVVRAGEDEYGIWVAGAIVPDATPKQIAKLRRSPLSGDWRRVENNLELTAALAVNVPAFPVYSMEGDGDRFALTAAGQVYPDLDDEVETEYDLSGKSADEVYSTLQDLASQSQAAEDNEQEQRAQWLRDLQDDELIYTQRDRTRKLEALRAGTMVTAPTAPTGGAAPSPDGAGPNTTAPTPSANAPAPPPQAPGNQTDSGAPVGADENTEMLQRQMNASFSVIQLPDGSTPPSQAPGTTAPEPAGTSAPAAAPAPAAPAPAPAQ